MTQPNVELTMEIEDPHQKAMVSFWWTSTLLKRAARQFFKDHGSSEADFNLLVTVLRATGPLTQNDLSQQLLVDKSNVTGLLDGLEKAGLVKRNAVPGDRRRYHVTLTAKGRKRALDLEERYGKQVAVLMSAYTAAEREELIRLTRKLRLALAESGL